MLDERPLLARPFLTVSPRSKCTMASGGWYTHNLLTQSSSVSVFSFPAAINCTSKVGVIEGGSPDDTSYPS